MKNSWAGAARAGLRPGMEIVQVNRQPVLKWIQGRIDESADRIGFSTEQQAFFYATHGGLTGDKRKRWELVIRNLKGKKQRGAVVFSGTNQVPDGPAFLPKGLQRTKDLIDTIIARAEALLEKFPQAKVPYNPARFGWKGPKRRRQCSHRPIPSSRSSDPSGDPKMDT